MHDTAARKSVKAKQVANSDTNSRNSQDSAVGGALSVETESAATEFQGASAAARNTHDTAAKR